MTGDDEEQVIGSRSEPRVETASPPLGPDRPTIEPTDALPTDELDDPEVQEDAASTPTPEPAGAADKPTRPPIDPADRPTIEPTDALPTDEQ